VHLIASLIRCVTKVDEMHDEARLAAKVRLIATGLRLIATGLRLDCDWIEL
jgi:hypothetical protein